MMRLHQSILMLGVAVMALLMLQGNAPAANEPPPVGIRVVDIVGLFNGLQEKKDGDADIKQMASKLEDQRNAKNDELKTMSNGLQDFKPGSDEYKDLSEKLLTKATELQAFGQYVDLKVKMEQRLRMAQLYLKINKTIQEYSKANGIGLVLATDDPDMSHARDEQELGSRIEMRKVIYAADIFDITQAIRDKMNSEYRVPAKP